MKLIVKRRLAARTLGVGLERISINPDRADEIKEAITRQDIRDLLDSGAFRIREIGGRKKSESSGRRKQGKRKLKVNVRKRNYVIITRKLRRHLRELRTQGKIDKAQHKDLRKRVKNRSFKSKKQLKEAL